MARTKTQKKATAERPRSPRSKRLRKNDSAARERALSALRAMRDGASISRAARENGVTIRTMKRYVGSVLVQDRPGGRIRARKTDRLVRYLQIPGPTGPIEITAHGSKQASEFAQYKAAINRLLRGDRNALAAWHGRKIAGIELVTDPKILISQARHELLPYSLYRAFAGGAA